MNMRAEERLLKYVAYETTSHEDTGTHPSDMKELVLAKALEEEMNVRLPYEGVPLRSAEAIAAYIREGNQYGS